MRTMPPMHCDTCGRYGNEEDGIEVGGECVMDDCDGTIFSRAPGPSRYHAADDPTKVLIWEVIEDILESVRLADTSSNGECFATVSDYVANYYGD